MIAIRPRTTGEILDDAWRLALADAPLLLALSGLFTVPAVIVCLLLVTLPRSEDLVAPLILPALAAVLLPLTGLGSGACQEVFRCRAEDRLPTLRLCLAGALRHGLDHTLARGLLLLLPLTIVSLRLFSLSYSGVAQGWLTAACLLLVVPLMFTWFSAATVHPLIAAGEARWYSALRAAAGQSQRQATKATVITLSRLVVVPLAAANLHGLLGSGLWALDQLGGFEVAVAEVVLSLHNPVYLLSLLLGTWLLLAPYMEASSYLLYLDGRVRYEGLDLWYRVRRFFALVERKVAVALLLAPVSLLLAVVPAQAADGRVEAVRSARQEIARLTEEVKAGAANGRWQARLDALAEKLDDEGASRPGRFQWFTRAIGDFERKSREQRLEVLEDLDRRLALVEDSLMLTGEDGGDARWSKEKIKSLLPPDNSVDRPRPKTEPKDRPPPTEPVRRDDVVIRTGPSGPGLVGPMVSSGLGVVGWALLIALLAGVVGLAVYLAWQNRPARPAKPAAKSESAEVSLEALLAQTDRAVGETLWREADDLARTGRFLEAVRRLYLAVLALLHRANLIRYASTRTNGEYLQQVSAQPDVYQPFRGLTGVFELKWYGEKSCRPEDYDTCRRLAEEVRGGIPG